MRLQSEEEEKDAFFVMLSSLVNAFKRVVKAACLTHIKVIDLVQRVSILLRTSILFDDNPSNNPLGRPHIERQDKSRQGKTR